MNAALKRIADAPLNNASNPNVMFDIYRVPFFLEPDYPDREDFFESNRDRLIRKWGGKREFDAQKQRHRLKERGLEVGINHFNLDRIASSTMASHILVQWTARTYGLAVSEAVYDRLNHLHFIEGRRLNDRALLVAVAAEAGLDAANAAAQLDSKENAEEIRKTFERVHAAGVTGIPTFVIDGGRLVMSGAAHADELELRLRELEAEVVSGVTKRPPPLFGPMLSW